MVRAAARSGGAGSTLRIIALDGTSKELQQAATAVPQSGNFRTVAAWMKLPAGATEVRVRLELTAPYSSLEVDDIIVDWEP
jgi:hypothetical protein